MAAQHAVQRNARDPKTLCCLGDILLGACKRVHKIEPFTVSAGCGRADAGGADVPIWLLLRPIRSAAVISSPSLMTTA